MSPFWEVKRKKAFHIKLALSLRKEYISSLNGLKWLFLSQAFLAPFLLLTRLIRANKFKRIEIVSDNRLKVINFN